MPSSFQTCMLVAALASCTIHAQVLFNLETDAADEQQRNDMMDNRAHKRLVPKEKFDDDDSKYLREEHDFDHH